MDSPPNDTLLDSLTPSGKTPETRIKDAASARAIYHRLRDADRESARNRAAVDALFAGEPPYDDAALKATGQGARANVNFGEAEALLESALSGYVDLLSSVETLVNFRTRYGDTQDRPEYELTISEEITRMLRGWGSYTPNWLRLATNFIGHGVGLAFFESDLDWRWRVGGLSDFYIPRKTPTSELDIEVACCVRSMRAHELYAFIKNEKEAADIGWDVEVGKKALIEAMSQAPATSVDYSNWEDVVREMKCNDLYVGTATASEVKVVHVWNVEFDQRVTHSIILESEPSGSQNFLYRKVGKFPNMGRAFTMFTYGVGMTGQVHSVRGLGAKVFPEIQMSNRLRCQMVDGAMLASSVLLKPANADALKNLQLTYFGPYTLLSPGVEIESRTSPNVATTVMPVLTDMSRLINSRTGGYAAETADPSPTEKTKYQVKSEQAAKVRLSTSALSLFYDPLDRLFREVVRRICRKGYLPDEPGGHEVREFRRRCLERGVPMEAIYQVDVARVTAVRAIGAGSEQMRQLVFEEFSAIAPALDDFGRRNLLRDRIATRVGYDNAIRYIQPPNAEARPLMDEKFANIENAALLDGDTTPVYPNDNHTVHARTHIIALSEQIQSVQEGKTDITKVLDGLAALQEHALTHVEAQSADPSVEQEAAANRQALQQANEVITNGLKHREKLRRQEEREQGESSDEQQTGGGVGPASGGLPGNQDMDAKLRMRLSEHRVKLQMLQEQSEMKMALAVQEAQQKLALKDAETAHRLAAGGR